MAVPDLDLARIRAYCEAKTPRALRAEMRVEARVRGNSVTVLECRPPWPEGAGDWTRAPLAQLRYNPAMRSWTLYWADRNDRWHLYELIDADQPVQRLIDEIEQDPTCIFWG